MRPSTIDKRASRQRPAVAASARIDMRLDPNEKKEIIAAAAESGESTASFVLQAVRNEIQRRRREREIIELSLRDQREFVQAILGNPEPNANLLAAARVYHDRIVRVQSTSHK